MKADDIGIALWGLDKTIALMFEATGKNLGRAALMNTIEQGKKFASGVYPPVALHPEAALRRYRRVPAEGRLLGEAVHERGRVRPRPGRKVAGWATGSANTEAW